MSSAALRPVPYRHLLEAPWARRLLLADVCARLPQGMATLALLLLVGARYSGGIAGLVLALYVLGQAIGAPVRGRLADRRGIYPVAVVCLAGYVALLVGVAVLARAAASVAAVGGAAAAAGLFTPPLSAAMRSLWSANAPGAVRHTAFALDAAVFDLAFIAGPALAALLVTRVAPEAGLFVMLAILALGVRATASVPDAGPAETVDHSPAPVRNLFRASLWNLLLVAACANLALTAVEVSLTNLARQQHHVWASGLLLAEVSIGSVVGSLLLGARARPFRRAADRLPALMAGYAFALALVALVSTRGLVVAAAAPVAGLCLGPALATLFAAAADSTPLGRGTETQAWVNTIMSGGASAGAAIAGVVASHLALGMGASAAAAAAGALIAARAARTTGSPRPLG